MTDSNDPQRPRLYLKYVLCEIYGTVIRASHQLGINYNRLSSYCAGSRQIRRQDLRRMAKRMKVSESRMQEIIEK